MAWQLCLMLLASVLVASNGITIDCFFGMVTWSYSGGSLYVYSCQATVSTFDNSEAITTITDSEASAISPNLPSDVQFLSLDNGFNLRVDHVPSNMATVFPKLVGIQWFNSKLKTISAADLAPYPNLVYLNIAYNMIRKLDGNLFQNNHKLQFIDLSYNSIQEIGPGLLDGLNALTYFQIYGNKCTAFGPLSFNPPYSTIPDVQRDLDFICGPKTETPMCEANCLANCTARAAALQTRANVVTESVYAPWYSKMRLFLKAVYLW